LERPQQYDRNVIDVVNTYSLIYMRHKITLKPLCSKEVDKDQIKMKREKERERERCGTKKRKLNHKINESSTFM